MSGDLVTITVQREDFDATVARLVAVGSKPPMAAVALAMYREASAAVFSEQDPFGHPWPPLAPKTLQKRQRRGNYSTKMLIDTGAMYQSMRTDSTADTASVSMDAPEEVHQFGTLGIPPRPIFPTDGSGESPPDAWWIAVGAPIIDALELAAAA